MQSCSWFWTETIDRSGCFIIKSSKSGISTKQQLANKFEVQTGNKDSPKTIKRRLKERDIKLSKNSKKQFVSEKNRLWRLSFARKHITGSVDEWKCVVLNPIENLWTELNCLTKDWRSKNEILHCRQSPKNSCISSLKARLVDAKLWSDRKEFHLSIER